MRIALGDSIRAASRTIGVTDRHGRRLVKQPQIEDAIRQYAAEAVDSARRVIVGKVRWAARRMVQLAEPGGSQHKGANVEFAALKYILDVNRVSEIQVGGTQSRILTFIPRDERDAPGRPAGYAQCHRGAVSGGYATPRPDCRRTASRLPARGG
jgi:hypothetical protein